MKLNSGEPCTANISPMGFNYVQTIKNRLFTCGGIAQDRLCFELVYSMEQKGFVQEKRSNMGVQRQNHSICTSGDDSFVVTGSNHTLASKKC